MTPQFLRTPRKASAMLAAVLAGGVLSAAALAQPSGQIMPQVGEVRLTLALGTRTVAFTAKSAPVARESVPFEAGGQDITPEGRNAMARLQESLFRQPGGSLVLVVYGEDEALAYKRARAVRGELAERHSMDPARIIAAGRKADGHGGDVAVVDVYQADATRCGGCNGSTFRTIALDSATMGLVTVTPEALPQAAAAQTARTEPAPAPKLAPRSAARPAARTETAAPPPPKPVTRHAHVRLGVAAAAGCPRPRIIIDDYYPGGPMVPCRPGR
jgi:hypothetical protein